MRIIRVYNRKVGCSGLLKITCLYLCRPAAIQRSSLLSNECCRVIMWEWSLGSHWPLERLTYRIYFSNTPLIRIFCATPPKFIVLNCSVLLSSRLLSLHYQGETNDGKICTGIWVFIILVYVWWRRHDDTYSVMKQGWGLAFYKSLWKGTRMKVVCGGNVGVGGGMESERWIIRAIRHASELLR